VNAVPAAASERLAIRIGTRRSALALAQARLAASAFQAGGRATRLVEIESDGDRRAPDTPWGEGAFVKAIERALIDGRVDVAIHSAKDIPIDEDPRLAISAYLPRADARDALVLRYRGARSLDELPRGATVGTDSPRRTAFLLAWRPDLRVRPLHGNVDTRLRRLDAGEADALVLACAGLDRLERSDRIVERIDVNRMPPAPGQGALALQIRRDDPRMLPLVASLDDRPTRLAAEAEREVLRAAGGGCRAPVGAYAAVAGAELSLVAGRAEVDGSGFRIGRRAGPAEDAQRIAIRLYQDLWPAGPALEAPQ
jgi:hydroxymethylbilane synthase